MTNVTRGDGKESECSTMLRNADHRMVRRDGPKNVNANQQASARVGQDKRDLMYISPHCKP